MKIYMVFLISSVVSISTIVPVQSTYYYQSQPYNPVPKTQTKLHFYVHDILGGKKPTAIQIAGPKDHNNPSPFGSMFAIDDILTEGPNITSKVIGSARGMWLSTNQDHNLTLVMCIDLGFTTGHFKGSSVSVLSRNPVTDNAREMAVVGGRGRFRMAKGVVLVKTVYLNEINGDAVLEYNVEVVHP